ncbi:hypothetical protein [Pseudoramibacter alactolyticus]|uniref:hypothetical protein n=1 Tax=Pseudoramibacter alactolyticus TaxID=113287 RepID=UPI0023564B4E|nr:hypothetical protein [Pseudoramibacter alactolyticus]MBM6967700.1 hypothetical protein [Pseudoramibacter alactolyticus]
MGNIAGPGKLHEKYFGGILKSDDGSAMAGINFTDIKMVTMLLKSSFRRRTGLRGQQKAVKLCNRCTTDGFTSVADGTAEKMNLFMSVAETGIGDLFEKVGSVVIKHNR